jgi:very-short-patch-repair endonuclease
MGLFTTESLEYLESHHGIASIGMLKSLGLSPFTVRRLVEAGNLESILRGVYRMPAVPLDEVARCVAVCAAHPEVVVSGPTAGRIWGLRRLPRDERIHVIAPPGGRPTTSRWVVAHRTAAIHDHDRVVRPDGIVVTGRPRTALDLARSVGAGDLLSIIEQVMHDGRCSDDQMRRVAVDWITPRRPWVRRYLETLNRRLPGGAAESHPETVVGDALAAAGLFGLERQYRIDLAGFGPARFDLAVPRVSLAIEVDMFPTHRESDGRRRDEWRDEAAVAAGWSVERLGEADLGGRLPATVQRIVALVRSLQR